MRYICHGIAARGSAHPEMEDAILMDDGLGLYAVADGVTRPAGGAIASRLAVESLLRFFREGRDLVAAVAGANRRITEERRAQSGSRLIGYTTLTAVAVDGRGYTLVHVGDSAAILCRKGAATLLTPAHHDEKGALTQCLGMEEGFAPYRSSGELRPGDHLILASDGVTSHVDPEEMGALAANHPEPGRIAARLIQAASVKPVYDDDKSVVVLYVEGM